jgi:hypothetical protein
VCFTADVGQVSDGSQISPFFYLFMCSYFHLTGKGSSKQHVKFTGTGVGQCWDKGET